MDVHAVRLDIAHQVALQIITYIGCIISVVCLVLAILTFQLFRGLKVIIITIPNFAPISNFQPRISLSFLSVGQNDHPQESLRVPVDRGNFIRLRNRANEPENCLRYRRWIIAFLFPLRIRLDVPRRYLYYFTP